MVQCLKAFKSWALHVIADKDGHNFSVEPFKAVYRYGYRVPRLAAGLFSQIIRAKRAGDYQRLILCLSVFSLSATVTGTRHGEAVKKIRDLMSLKPVSYTKVDEHQYRTAISDYLERKHRRFAPKVVWDGWPLEPIGSTVAVGPGINGSYYLSLASWEFLTMPIYGFNQLPAFEGHVDQEAVDKPLTFFGGNISVLTKDRGCKLRLVAVCNPYISGKLIPLKRYLLSLLRETECDCTYDQDEGRKWLMSQTMEQSSYIWSIDTKDWTYHFPQAIQRWVLEALFVSHDTIRIVFESVWSTTLEVTPAPSYFAEKGQLMGLGLSFPLASIAHHVVLQDICYRNGKRPVDTYRILGDDIVIADRVVANEYKKFLDRWEIPISREKSFLSRYAGEFAGRFFLQGRDITPYKWNTWNVDNVNVLANMGYYVGLRGIVNLLYHQNIRIGKNSLSYFTLMTFCMFWGLPRRFGGKAQPHRGILRKLGVTLPLFNRALRSKLYDLATYVPPCGFGLKRPPVGSRVHVGPTQLQISWMFGLKLKFNRKSLVRTPYGDIPWSDHLASLVREQLAMFNYRIGYSDDIVTLSPDPAATANQLRWPWCGYIGRKEKTTLVRSYRKIRKTLPDGMEAFPTSLLIILADQNVSKYPDAPVHVLPLPVSVRDTVQGN
jgi:hypothetical protein